MRLTSKPGPHLHFVAMMRAHPTDSGGEIVEHGYLVVKDGKARWTPTLLNFPPATPDALNRAGQAFRRATLRDT